MDEFLAKLKTPISELWEKNKLFLVCFIVLILIVKFHDAIFDAIVSSSKKLLEESTKKDQILKTEEKAANDQANKLVEQSKALDSNKPTVDDNWFKK